MRKDLTERFRTTELGVIKINNNAITTIASIAAMEVRGVKKVGGGMGRTLCELLCIRPGNRGVRIHVAENDLKISLYLTVEYGVDISRLADEVQENVKRSVEKMAGIAPSSVDVVIEGVDSPKESGSGK